MQFLLETLYAVFLVVVGGLQRLIYLGLDASMVLGCRGLSAATAHKCSPDAMAHIINGKGVFGYSLKF